MFVTVLIVKEERSEERRSERFVLQFIKLFALTSYLTKKEKRIFEYLYFLLVVFKSLI